MKLIRLATIALLLGVCANCSAYAQSSGYGPPPPGYDHDRDYNHDRGYDDGPTPGVEVGFFYDELSPYGDWVLTRDFGWAWFPAQRRATARCATGSQAPGSAGETAGRRETTGQSEGC